MSLQALSAGGSYVGLALRPDTWVQRGGSNLKHPRTYLGLGSTLESSPAEVRGRKESRLDRILE